MKIGLKTISKIKRQIFLILPTLIFFCFFYITIFTNITTKRDNIQQFVLLSESFIHGHLNFERVTIEPRDMVLFNGKYYWPLGPFPAILNIPFTIILTVFGLNAYQGYTQLLLYFFIFALIVNISKKIGYSFREALFWTFAFCYSSVFIGTILNPSSWHFAHVVVVVLSFLSINEYLGKKRYWLIGIIMGLLYATRIPASLLIIFYILEALFNNNKARSVSKQKLLSILKLVIPYLLIFLLIGYYNYARFGNFWEHGYNLSDVIEKPIFKARSYGLFSIKHIPGNLYYFLLSTPVPIFADEISHVLKFPFIAANPWGMSIFITSPYFFYLFFLKYKDKISKFIWFTILAILIPILLYCGIGYYQFGYRYSLDFLPLLFFLLMRNMKLQKKPFSNKFKVLIFISAIFNLYLLFILY